MNVHVHIHLFNMLAYDDAWGNALGSTVAQLISCAILTLVFAQHTILFVTHFSHEQSHYKKAFHTFNLCIRFADMTGA